MNTPLAWKNLVHNKVRTAVALAGVGFAVILMFMQIGFKEAIKKTATQIYDALDFDLMLGESGLCFDGLPRELEEVGHAGVELDLGTEPAEEIIAEAGHPSLSDICEDVIQVEVVALDQLGAVVPVERLEPVDLSPKLRFVHFIMAKQRALHVAGDQGLVEVPDHCNHVLGEQLPSHGT